MDRQKEILQYNVEWLKFAETKATLILTIQGVLLTVIYSNANDLYNAILNSKLQLFFSVISAILFFLTLLFCFFAINPNLKNHLTKSAIYFGTIKNYKDYKEYSKSLNDFSETEIKEMLSEQIYINSKIAWNKFVKVGWAIRFFTFLLLVLFIQVLIYIF